LARRADNGVMVSVSLAAGRSLLARQRAGLALHGLIVIALVPAFVWLAPASDWGDPVLVMALVALAVITDRHEIPLPGGIGFDALLALMLIAVATAGPLPALALIVVPWIVNVATGREPPLRAGALANLAGYGCQAITAALTLQLVGGSFFGLLAAGNVLYSVGWAVGPAIYAPLWLGQPLRTLTRAFADMLPAGAVMIALAAITVSLLAPWGLAALALFAVIAVLPQSALTFLARTRPVARLDPAVATRRYANALAVQLGLSRTQRRHLAAVARRAHDAPATGDPADYIAAGLSGRDPVGLDAQMVTEWWNGAGGPTGVPGPFTPLASQVVAVAHTWSALTAAGGPKLAHADALEHLQTMAGLRLHPKVVTAAGAVISEERVTPHQPAPEPRLHHLGMPRRLRIALACTT